MPGQRDPYVAIASDMLIIISSQHYGARITKIWIRNCPAKKLFRDWFTTHVFNKGQLVDEYLV
jgi:hypothetical protein